MPQARNPNQTVLVGAKAARDRFTNRVDETRRFLELLNAPAGSSLPLLMFYGVGGVGKSSLLDHLQQRCETWNPAIPWAAVDLQHARDPARALPRLVSTLEIEYGIRFESFKRVLAVLSAKLTGEETTKSDDARGQTVDLGFDLLGLIPGAGQIISIARMTTSAAKLAWPALLKNPVLAQAVQSFGGQDALLPLLDLKPEQLVDELVRTFAADLSLHAPHRQGIVGRCALFFDTHEALWEDKEGHAGTRDTWLRLLREYLHEQGVLMVMAGRDTLRWPDDWLERDEHNQLIWLEQHLIGGLSRIDALEFLRRADASTPDGPLNMPEALQDAILTVTNERPSQLESAHHCYLLSLCMDIVGNTKAQTGSYPNPNEFSTIPTGDKASMRLVERFLKSLPNQTTANWLEELSLTPRFDERFALELDAFRQYGNGRAGWNRLLQLSLLQEQPGGFLEMHKLLQATLRDRISEAAAKPLHAWAFEHWTARGEALDSWELRGLGWYHHRYVDSKGSNRTYINWIWNARDAADLQTMLQIERWSANLVLTIPPTNTLQAEDIRIVSISFDAISFFRMDPSDYTQKSITLNKAALHFYTQEAFPEQWLYLQERLGNAYSELTNGELGENFRLAKHHFENVLNVINRVSNPYMWSFIQRGLGSLYQFFPYGDRRVNFRKAIEHYSLALDVRKKQSEPTEWAIIQQNIGSCYIALAEYSDEHLEEILEEAVLYFRASLSILDKQKHKKHWLEIQSSLAATLFLPLNASQENIVQAISLLEAVLGSFEHQEIPFLWAVLSWCLGDAYVKKADNHQISIQKSISCYQNALVAIRKDEYPVECAICDRKLGNAYLSLQTPEHLEAALKCFEQAVNVFDSHLFPIDHARTQRSMGSTLKALGDITRASEAFDTALRIFNSLAMHNSARDVRDELIALGRQV
jgi:tetratricopeptide (TPR) repeat protein